MSNQTTKFNIIDSEIRALSARPGFENAQKVINAVVGLFDLENAEWKLFNDSQGKIRSNATWFKEAQGFSDRRATYKIADSNSKNIDFKAYWTKNTSKSIISWLVALTPNFEDEDFDLGDKVGIDFIIPEDADRVIVALSNRFIVRTLELSESLSITEQEIFAKWQQDFDFSNKAQFHELLWNSFDFEPVNKKFFKEISAFFTELRQYLSEDIKIFDEKHAAYFTNRLIGRIVFCWFLDKKGIINPEMNYFEVEEKTATDYYRQKLEILFFKVLNTPIDERGDGIEKITPFLNGGLFEVKNNDKFGVSELKFPADYFDRFFKFLRHYNFTTDESTSTFQQVAIDPEMLGRIFENLLAEQTEETGQQARKAKGAFYTPREIVDYMCRESLREYLKTKTEAADELGQKIDQLLDSKPHEWRDQQKNYRDKLKADKYNILQALDEIKVLDPACGSGAFPMGMLHLLLQTYERIDSTFDSYKKKMNIIKNSLFGVDIEPMAVEISRLRAWLSIIVDEESDSKKIEPLPNLDFKFICANSLIPLEKNGQTAMGDDPNLENKITDIRDTYYNARKFSRKMKLKDDFNKLMAQKNQASLLGKSKKQEQLESYYPFDQENVTSFFDPKFMYGESNFDVVIGNPPYVRQEQIKYKDDLQRSYSIYKSRADLYTYFYEMSLRALSDEGIFAFITSSKFMRAAYGVELRKLLKHKVNIKQIIDFGDTHMFAAITNTAIIIAQKDGSESGEFLYGSSIGSNLNKISQENLKDENWTLAEGETLNLMKKVEKAGKLLKNWDVQINYGIKTGYNDAYIIDEQKKNELISQDPKNKYLIKPIIRGRDIKKYGYEWANLYIIIAKFDSHKFLEKEYPVIFNHLKGFETKLKKRGQCNYSRSSNKNSNKEYPGQHHWLEFDNNPKDSYIDEFKKEKIIWIELTNKNKFTFSDHEQYVLAGAFLMTGNNLKYLLGILNSRLCRYYFNLICNSSGMATIQWKKFSVEKIPVPEINAQNKMLSQKIIELVDKILAIKKEDVKTYTSDLEKSIDDQVYKLYGVTNEEIKLIENN